MDEYANSLKQTLTSLIRKMSAAPAPYVKNPETDFTCKKKLPFETVMQLLISMGGNSIYKELLESQGYDVHTTTTSAFVQQRNKILPSAVEFLFHEFTQSYTDIKHYQGTDYLPLTVRIYISQPTLPTRIPISKVSRIPKAITFLDLRENLFYRFPFGWSVSSCLMAIMKPSLRIFLPLTFRPMRSSIL